MTKQIIHFDDILLDDETVWKKVVKTMKRFKK